MQMTLPVLLPLMQARYAEEPAGPSRPALLQCRIIAGCGTDSMRQYPAVRMPRTLPAQRVTHQLGMRQT